MAITAASPVREHEKPMSWPRAILIAVGFFFVTAILLGQLPSYVYTVSTLSTLQLFEQGFLTLGLLAAGLGLICFEVVWLYDVKPLLPWPLFAGAGAVIAAIGVYIVYQVYINPSNINILGQPGWSHLLPATGYLIHPAWFQQGSIDLAAVGMVAIMTGFGMLTFAVLTPFVLSGRLVGPARDLLVRLSLGIAIVISTAWGVAYTFAGSAVLPDGQDEGAAGNVVLFIALMLALFALVVWFLPVMVANRQQFMPGMYLYGVVGLIGMIAVPLLIAWAVVYPLVNLIHSVDSTEFWVQCSQKNAIPASCTFSQFTGYIICAIVFTNLFAILIAGIYFWSTRRNTVILGGIIATVFLALAVSFIHTDEPGQVPFGIVSATAIAVLAFLFTSASQREFAPTAPMQLGCIGQWLVLGTLMLFFLLGYAFFSLPTFFEMEAGLAMQFKAGNSGQHDAFWSSLLVLGLAAFQLVVLIRRRDYPMGNLRKFVLWTLAIGLILMMAGAIQPFHTDVLSGGINAIEGSSALIIAALCFEIVGVAAALYGAYRMGSWPWRIAIIAFALVGIALAFISYYLPDPYPELTIFGFILASLGGWAYAAGGLDPEQADELAYAEANGYNGNGNGNGNGRAFAVTRP
jgi:hypothetical protein